jgi:hypothetical protein
MAPTPDRRGGPLYEEEIIFDDRTPDADPEDERTMRYKDGRFRMVDVGGDFDPVPLVMVHFGNDTKVPSSGTQWLEGPGKYPTSSVPLIPPVPLRLIAMTLRTDVPDAERDYKLAVYRDGIEVALANMLSGNDSAFINGLSVDFTTVQELSVGVFHTSGPTKKSDFSLLGATLVFRVLP